MSTVSRYSKVFAACILLSLLLSCSRATLISKRHSIHLSVNEPDDPRFSLFNLARIFYLQLRESQRNRATGDRKIDLGNPYEIEQNCNQRAEFRNINGTCNNLRSPFMGAAKTPLMRLTANRYEDGLNSPRANLFSSGGQLPTARSVSLAIHETISNISRRHSHLMMNFGQFTDHDITLSPEAFGEGGVESPKERCCKVDKALWINDLKECFALSTKNDRVFSTDCVQFVRSSPVPALPDTPVVRFQLNDLTAYIDGSQIYGSTNRRATSLRSFRDGRLRTSTGLDNEERLPLAENNPTNCFSETEECRFAAGDVRSSEQAALSSVHTLMLREHNRIARTLKGFNVGWSDERLYQTTRKIIGAILQRITYREFLPEVVGPAIMQQYGLTLLESGRFTGYSRSEDASIVTEFSTAAFRFGHSMIRQTFGRSATQSLDIRNVFDAFKTVEEFGSNSLLQGLTNDNMEVRDRFITTGIRDNLLGLEMDLPAFNIQRGRDHGLSSYNDIRRSFTLSAQSTFSGLVGKTHKQASVAALQKVYPNTEDMEVFPAGLSEIPLSGAIVGETFAHIIGTQFRSLKFGDRFWHETNDRNIRFTARQLAEIRKVSFASLFCGNVEGVTVRRSLLLADISGNSPVACSSIPTMDLSAWRE